MGKLSRTKGHAFERWVAEKLRGIFPEARRHLEYHSADANGVDISHTGVFKFQCKKLKTYAPINCIFEIEAEPAFGDVPVLVTAGDRMQPMAVLAFDDLLWLIENASVSK